MNDSVALSVILIIGIMAGAGVASMVTKTNIERSIASGELACEYYRSRLICWNPKEVER